LISHSPESREIGQRNSPLSLCIQKYPTKRDSLSESTHSSSINIRPLRHFEDVTAAVKELNDKIQDSLKNTWTNISGTGTQPDVLLPEPEPEPKTRAEFLKYSRDITLDLNTAHRKLSLFEGNRKVKVITCHHFYPDHPDRFTDWFQILSRESLTGRCYWEVEWRGDRLYVAVSYKNISRTGSTSESAFGLNDKSWALYCDTYSYKFWYNTQTPISGPRSSRIGVYLDHSAGILSFYSVSEKMTLLHRVQTTFTEPLHAGVRLYYAGNTAKFIKLT
uniref:B30.2/SPRY domain-containing protein n=1 Tax=Acanthochromis polyacanthus TaxID=80966 RepID=A0A3Q1HZC7_9TELE